MLWPLVLVFLLAALAGSFINAATYAWAWNYRRISPWQLTPQGVARRTWLDCVPIFGWLRLRRDQPVLGRRFWVRPMLVELLFASAMTALCWYECYDQGLIEPQSDLALGASFQLLWPTIYAFLLHAILAGLMAIATLIDIDEKTIPDEITVPGVLLGLALATFLPSGLLPNIEERYEPPAVGDQLIQIKVNEPILGRNGSTLWIEPTTLASPNDWPNGLLGGESMGLAIGLGCYWLWCVALTTRIWRGRRGFVYGLSILLRRIGRDLLTRPLREILVGGTLAIICIWHTGGPSWIGLMTSLVGMAVGGSIVWAVRVIGSAALGKEAMGFGDVTLMMMIGAFLGWQASVVTFFFAPFAALILGVVQYAFKRDDVIPYGPFLCLGAAAVVVRWGTVWPVMEKYCALGPVLPTVLIVCLAMLGFILWVWALIKARLLGASED